MNRRFPWVSAFALACACSACGTILGVDDYEVDPNFAEGDDDADDDSAEPDVPHFDPDDDADDDADDDVTDDDSDDDVTDDDADDDSDDDVTDDDSDDDVTDDDADDDVTDDDSDDDVTDDDVVSPEAGADDEVEPDVAPDDDVEPEPMDDDVVEECFAPVSGTCDNVPQCGCGEDNCEFDLDDSGATSCVRAGRRAPYSECTATTNQCPVGFSCVGGLCREFCSGADPTCEQGPYAKCRPVGAADGSNIPEFFVCARTCDPRNPTSEEDGNLACGVGVACLPAEDGVSNCYATVGSRAAGQGCADEYGYPDPLMCLPGLGCAYDADYVPRCQPYCEVGSADCGPGAECVPSYPNVFAGGTEMGTCSYCENVPAGGACAYFPQCGCDDGEMCYPDEYYTATCVPAGEQGLNEFCSATEICGPGLDCLRFTGSDRGVCTQLCQEAADCPSYDTACVDLGYMGGTGHCLWGCDPSDPSSNAYPFLACGADQTCAPVYDLGGSLCAPAGAGAAGATCLIDTDCMEGLGCGVYGCTEWCGISTSWCNSATASCFESYGAVSAGVEFGLCYEAVLSLTSTLEPTAIPDFETGAVVSTITAPAYNPSRVTVEVDITHTYVGDLRLELRSPNGTLVVLLSGVSLGSGQNLTATRFDDSGPPIGYGTAPYTGAFQPDTPLKVLNGTDTTGDWTLTVTDDANLDTGILNSWTLHFW